MKKYQSKRRSRSKSSKTSFTSSLNLFNEVNLPSYIISPSLCTRSREFLITFPFSKCSNEGVPDLPACSERTGNSETPECLEDCDDESSI